MFIIKSSLNIISKKPTNMKNLFKLLFLIHLLFAFKTVNAQSNYTVSGHLHDSLTKEPLVGAVITLKELNTGTISNDSGFFSINVPKGNYHLIIDYLGYKSIKKKVDINNSTTLHFQLLQDNELLREVEVSAEGSDKNVNSNEMSINKMSMK